MKTTSFILFTLFGLQVFAQTTTTNVNFGFSVTETESNSGEGVNMGMTITETESTPPPPTQVIVVHEVVPAPPAIPACVVDGSEMGNILESIRSKTYDNTQQSQAKTIIQNKCLTSQQMKQVLNIFSFEHTKLEMAKYAYQYVADKNNYYLVNDVFEYPFSVEELNEYISGN